MGRHTPSGAHAAHDGEGGSSSDDSDESASGADSARGDTRACPSPAGLSSSGGEGEAGGGSGKGGGGSRGLPAEAAARLSELEATLRRLTKVPFTGYPCFSMQGPSSSQQRQCQVLLHSHVNISALALGCLELPVH